MRVVEETRTLINSTTAFVHKDLLHPDNSHPFVSPNSAAIHPLNPRFDKIDSKSVVFDYSPEFSCKIELYLNLRLGDPQFSDEVVVSGALFDLVDL